MTKDCRIVAYGEHRRSQFFCQGQRMHENLKQIRQELQTFLVQMKSVVPEHSQAFNVAHGNWASPGISGEDIRFLALSLIELLDSHDQDEVDAELIAQLRVFPEAISYAKDNTLPNLWSNTHQAGPVLYLMLDAIQAALRRVLKVDPDDAARAAVSMRKVRSRLKGLESTIGSMEPRAKEIEFKVSRIEQAHDAADRLPTDLEQLEEARKQIKSAVADAQENCAFIRVARTSGDETMDALRKLRDEASAVVERCDKAYAAATSQGLAAAFTERSKKLSFAVVVWVIGLVTALIAGGWLGHLNATELSALLLKDAPAHVVIIRAFMSMVALVGPVWFAWLATKQINQNFRLSEDYGFKASISRAYEGYRKEAARVGGDLESILLRSALDRLDELPLRLVENTNHGSPWQEILSSDAVRNAVRSVPGFSSSVVSLAKSAVRPKAAGTEKKSEANAESGGIS